MSTVNARTSSVRSEHPQKRTAAANGQYKQGTIPSQDIGMRWAAADDPCFLVTHAVTAAPLPRRPRQLPRPLDCASDVLRLRSQAL